jgi:phosphatidylglycerophosphate synthase
MLQESDRRPIPLRQAWWSRSLAARLVALGVKPNQISLASVAFSSLGAIFLYLTADTTCPARVACLIGAAFCIQLRLLCNMLDGMVALEGGMASKSGVLFNEIPDRVADTVLLVSAGYASNSQWVGIALGWAAAFFALMTAYLRAFGAAQGFKQDFCGPMAKQHRMAVLTAAALLASLLASPEWTGQCFVLALWLIVIGAFITCMRRTSHLVEALNGD